MSDERRVQDGAIVGATIEEIANAFADKDIEVFDYIEGSEGPVRAIYFHDGHNIRKRVDSIAERYGFRVESLQKIWYYDKGVPQKVQWAMTFYFG